MCKHLQSHACFVGDVAARSRSEEVIKGSQTHKGETPSEMSEARRKRQAGDTTVRLTWI